MTTTQERKASTVSMLPFPDGALKPAVFAHGDGSTGMCWQGSVHHDSDEPDLWGAILSADRRRFQVFVAVDGPWWMSEIEGTLREVLRHQSGVSVELCITWKTPGDGG